LHITEQILQCIARGIEVEYFKGNQRHHENDAGNEFARCIELLQQLGIWLPVFHRPCLFLFCLVHLLSPAPNIPG
jgi:hypothetical protein